ncbi:VanZ family protein [Lysinibacillus telephonicus]|uniref:VanZ family protein n=2 Tax=Bacillaceae TaxID=186817 RepID=A0A431UU10_9BACI|nr:VanZ family protein [Lysinibacillus telephonicus]RTQ93640.1 VanZ family protein [Lysinibacillus telephonicus]
MQKVLRFCYWFILLFYVFLLVDTVFISRESLRSVNLIPFNSIKEFIMVDNGFGQVRIVDMNILGNILMFVPAGIYIILHKKHRSIMKNLFIILLSSLAIEATQFIFALGALDIDDIILNVMGGFIGLAFYKMFEKLFKDENRIRTAISILSLIVGLPILVLTLLLFIAN